jgi:hypothetical protein
LTVAIIGVLVVAWIAFLAPTILRARNNQGRADSVGDFHHRLRALSRTNGTQRKGPRPVRSNEQAIFSPMGVSSATMSPAQRGRRDILVGLDACVAVSMVVALITRQLAFIFLQLAADGALGGYVYLLVQYKQRARAPRPRGAPVGVSAAPPYIPLPTYRMAEIDVGGAERSGPRLVPLRQTASG